MNGTYTAGVAISAEGSRVAIVTCHLCGAALLVDPANTFDVFTRHDEWHNSVARR